MTLTRNTNRRTSRISFPSRHPSDAYVPNSSTYPLLSSPSFTTNRTLWLLKFILHETHPVRETVRLGITYNACTFNPSLQRFSPLSESTSCEETPNEKHHETKQPRPKIGQETKSKWQNQPNTISRHSRKKHAKPFLYFILTAWCTMHDYVYCTQRQKKGTEKKKNKRSPSRLYTVCEDTKSTKSRRHLTRGAPLQPKPTEKNKSPQKPPHQDVSHPNLPVASCYTSNLGKRGSLLSRGAPDASLSQPSLN